ncbi:MAG: type II toxin-antitoxin system HicB family antitoxin [Paludibacter sp.]|jgi:predicted RNase H-like HicB family nuclease|nr:type II toxin-antitoxin system HicB family antitoxin [Paludibacter sp.]
MGKVTVTVEITDNNYAAYLDELPGCVSTGKTFEELKQNIADAVEFHLDGMREDGDEIPSAFATDYELIYKFDPQSLLILYNGIFTNAALERLTGINQRQLQRYSAGTSRPRREQSSRITHALHHLGRELLAVEL